MVISKVWFLPGSTEKVVGQSVMDSGSSTVKETVLTVQRYVAANTIGHAIATIIRNNNESWYRPTVILRKLPPEI